MRVLKHVLLEGHAWEVSTMCLISQLKSRKKIKKKRLGSRAAKQAELLQHKGQFMEGEQATQFRALAARANYLALDRPDLF